MEAQQLGEKNNLRLFYEEMNKQLDIRGSDFLKNQNNIISYEIKVPKTHKAHSSHYSALADGTPSAQPAYAAGPDL